MSDVSSRPGSSEGDIPLLRQPFFCPSPLPELEQPQPQRDPAQKTLRAAAPLVIALLGLVVLPTIFLRNPHFHHNPYARKAAAMVVTSDDRLTVWSGMGHGEIVLSDAATFDLKSQRWSRAHIPKRWREIHPQPRSHAAGCAYNNDLIVHGGECASVRNSALCSDGVWMLSPGLRWHSAHVSAAADATSRRRQLMFSKKGSLVDAHLGDTALQSINRAPGERRLHSLVTCTLQDNSQHLILFGGTGSNGTLMADTWRCDLALWPHIRWRLLHSNNVFRTSSAPGGYVGGNDVVSGASYRKGQDVGPQAREGHAAAAVTPRGNGTRMLVFGGFDGSRLLNDLWSLDVDIGEWQRIEPVPGSPLPAPRRDHAAAFYYREHANASSPSPSAIDDVAGTLLVWGGRGEGGKNGTMMPLGDLWAFDMGLKIWKRVPQYGLKPLPRYLFSSSLHKSAMEETGGHRGLQWILFGGETLEKCKLNDVWALQLDSMLWKKLARNVFARRRCDRVFSEARKAK
jgi:hypothetical protein